MTWKMFCLWRPGVKIVQMAFTGATRMVEVVKDHELILRKRNGAMITNAYNI